MFLFAVVWRLPGVFLRGGGFILFVLYLHINIPTTHLFAVSLKICEKLEDSGHMPLTNITFDLTWLSLPKGSWELQFDHRGSLHREPSYHIFHPSLRTTVPRVPDREGIHLGCVCFLVRK